MYDFTGLECPVCHQPFRLEDDIVVCPDCGAPYHRACFLKAGSCVYAASHSPSFEWTPPKKPAAMHACPVCGETNPPDVKYCQNCGAPLGSTVPQRPAKATQPASSVASAAGQKAAAKNGAFDYSTLYSSTYTADEESPFSSDGPVPIDPNEKMEGIPAAEWASYIGKSSPIYLIIFKQMELLKRKVAFSLSAMIFGPFYFMYRKAWKPAAFFSLLACLVRLPVFLSALQLTDSALTAGMSAALLENLSLIANCINYGIILLRGLYGYYLYKKDAAAHIRQIQSQYPDTQKRSFVLTAQGGTSMAAVLALAAVFLVLIYVGLALFVGPNLNALANSIGYTL